MPWGSFLLWLLLGAGYTLALLGAMTIGVFILPFAIAGTLIVMRRPRATDGLAGLISGLGLPVLYVAFLNRDGPGTICTAINGGGQQCSDETSPWPWLSIGVALLVIGAVVFTMRHRHPARAAA